MDRQDVIASEDLVTFLGAATTETRQEGFYTTATGIPLDFLHAYVRINYRDLYVATLALAINDLHAGLVIENLLAHPDDTTPTTRRAEGELIAARLAVMAPQRAWKLWERLARAGQGNRRLRAIVQQWLDTRDVAFDAIKYRRAMRLVVRHLHLRVPAEVADVLTGRWRRTGQVHGEAALAQARSQGLRPEGFALLATWRRAHYEDRAVFELPFTVAEGLAARRGIDRATLVRRGTLTAGERLRLVSSSARHGIDIAPDLARAPLTRLATYVLSLDPAERAERREELTSALRSAARRAVGSFEGTWGRVTAVLDDSYSSSGSTVARRRSLIVAVAVRYALDVLATDVAARWTSGRTDTLLVTPRGSTDLATPVLDALATEPDLLVIVSDAVDTDPPGAAGEVLRVWSQRIDDGTTAVVHLNPVFDPDRYAVRTLTPAVPTLGIRDAADLPLLRDLAAVARGTMTRRDLSKWLMRAPGSPPRLAREAR